MDGVMIAFTPAEGEWSKVDLPHMTLVYAGTTSQRMASDFNAIAKDAATIAQLTRPFGLRSTGVDVFGDGDEKVEVLKLRPTVELQAFRRFVEPWNKSQHKEFRPHVTLGPVGTTKTFEYTPSSVYFTHVVACWGDDVISFKL